MNMCSVLQFQQAFKDIRSTASMYMQSKDETITNLVHLLINQKEEQRESIFKSKQIQKKRYIDLEYVTTKDAAVFIGVDTSYLTKRKGKTFKLGIHFFKPEYETIVRWKISALTDWLTGKQNNSNNVDSKLENLLKRR